MGRIKTTLIKRTAKKLLQENEAGYSTEFSENKKNLESTLEVHSKKLRNVVAGYITKLKKRKK